MVFFTVVAMIMSGVDFANAFTIAVSCVGNVGPSLSTTIGEVTSWSALPAGTKWLLCLLMLMGRLEIMTVLVLFTPQFWKEN
jgi:trk system potassium uptake protein TrkH